MIPPQKGKNTMKKRMLKIYFWATEEQHGKEQTRLHAVYMPHKDEETGQHITLEQQIERGTAALLAAGYYDIKYGSTIETTLIFA